jgi:hypothetical protein
MYLEQSLKVQLMSEEEWEDIVEESPLDEDDVEDEQE